jgi:hypothetical protein
MGIRHNGWSWVAYMPDVGAYKKGRSGDGLIAVVIVYLVDEGPPKLVEVSGGEVESHDR